MMTDNKKFHKPAGSNSSASGSNKSKKAEGGSMPLTSHLTELRNRLVRCIIAVLVLWFIGVYISPHILFYLTNIGKEFNYTYIYISPQELMMQYFQVGLIFSLICSSPVILYEIYAFMQPGLKKTEQKAVAGALLFGMVMFAIGVLFALKVIIPFMLRFLIGIGHGTNIQASITVGNYISFLLTMFIIFGIIFEMPVICVLLTQIGILKVDTLVKVRKYAIVVIFVLSAIITPPDALSQIMVAIPMLTLYQFSIFICKFFVKNKAQKQPEEDEEAADDDMGENSGDGNESIS